MTTVDYEEIDANIEKECAFLWISQQDANDIIETLKDAWFLNKEWEKFYSRHREKHRKENLLKCDSCWEYSEMVASLEWPNICELCRD